MQGEQTKFNQSDLNADRESPSQKVAAAAAGVGLYIGSPIMYGCEKLQA